MGWTRQVHRNNAKVSTRRARVKSSSDHLHGPTHLLSNHMKLIPVNSYVEATIIKVHLVNMTVPLRERRKVDKAFGHKYDLTH